MKQSVILAGLAAGLVSANAHMPKHNHANNHVRRQIAYTTTITTITEMDYVTLAPGQAPPVEGKAADFGDQGVAGGAGGAPGGGPNQYQAQAATTSSSSTIAAPVIPAPISNPPVQAAAVNPNPTTLATTTPASPVGGGVAAPSITNPAECPLSPPDAYQNCVNSAQGYINSMQKAADYAHQDSMGAYQGTIGAQTGGPPVNPTVHAPSHAPSQPGAPAPSNTGSAAPGGDHCVDTFMTYYGGQGGTGSCGYPISDSNNTVAIAANLMPKCNQVMSIWIDGASEAVDAIVADTCPACGSDGHVDASQDWAQTVAPDIVTPGHVPIRYCWKS